MKLKIVMKPVIKLYEKLRPDDKVCKSCKEFLRMRLFEVRRYDLQPVGRYKLNKN